MAILKVKDSTGKVSHIPAIVGPKGDKGEVDVYPWAKKETKPTYTADEVGAAPAGYGLGTTSPKVIVGIDGINNAIANGWYYVTDINYMDIMDGVYFGYALLHVIGKDNYHTKQILYPAGTDYVLCRMMTANVWGEWGIDNPPMLPGVEYRTTERWNGKAVYTKLVNGGIVGTGGVMVYWRFSKTPTHIVRTVAKINTEAIGDIVLPHIYGTMESGYTAVCAPCRDSILFACGANVTGQAYAQVWYTYD